MKIFTTTCTNTHAIYQIMGIKIKTKIPVVILNKFKTLANIARFSKVQSALQQKNKKIYGNKFLFFRYDYCGLTSSQKNVNLGDYVQTIATQNVIKKIFSQIDYTYFDRDNLINYNGENAFTIMQGWFSHTGSYLPNEKILPIYIGTHLTTTKRDEFLNFVKVNPEYFKNAVIGCRDTSTLDFIKSIELPCYLSRCLTLTFDKRIPSPTQNKIFIVNIPKNYLNYIPHKLVENAEFVNQRSIDANHEASYYINSETKYLETTNQLLENYRNNAKLVITSALHCASPCIAMGIPTILIDFEKKNDRFGSLKGLIKIYNVNDLINNNIDYSPKPIDIEHLKKLMIKNVELSIKQVFGENVNQKELNQIRNEIENYNLDSNACRRRERERERERESN